MKLLVILLGTLALSGCASKCTHACLFGFGPSSDAFEQVARHYDTTDACQYKGKPLNYELPYYCGHKSTNYRITDRNGHTIGYIK
jgi:hypothetical protein